MDLFIAAAIIDSELMDWEGCSIYLIIIMVITIMVRIIMTISTIDIIDVNLDSMININFII